VPALADREQALAWARAEHANLLACLDYATRTGQDARVVTLTAGIAALLRHDGPWAEAITRTATAVRLARHLGDRRGQANALRYLGNRGGRAGIIRVRPGTWRRRWASTGTSATSSARPTPSATWGKYCS
jgi:hypothetical protein